VVLRLSISLRLSCDQNQAPTYHPSFLRSYYDVRTAHDDINADHEDSFHKKSPDRLICSELSGDIWASRVSGAGSPIAVRWATASGPGKEERMVGHGLRPAGIPLEAAAGISSCAASHATRASTAPRSAPGPW
jgi:hypothetical protein